MNNLNVVCIKWGDKYSADFVNKLHSMVQRNLTLEHNFICITEDATNINPGITIKNFEDDSLKGWWQKLSIFKKDAYDLKGKILYIDLDMVITGNIDCLVHSTNKFCTIKGWLEDEFIQSSIMCFETGKFQMVWEDFQKNKISIVKNFKSDQDYLSKILPKELIGFFPSDWLVSYKWHCKSKGLRLFGKVGQSLGLCFAFGDAILPKGTKVVAFHGEPNPKQVRDKSWLYWKKAPFVKEHWR